MTNKVKLTWGLIGVFGFVFVVLMMVVLTTEEVKGYALSINGDGFIQVQIDEEIPRDIRNKIFVLDEVTNVFTRSGFTIIETVYVEGQENQAERFGRSLFRKLDKLDVVSCVIDKDTGRIVGLYWSSSQDRVLGLPNDSNCLLDN